MRIRKIAKTDYWQRPVCLPAWNNSAPTGRNFHEISYLRISRKSVEKIQVGLKSTSIRAILRENLCTHMIPG